MRARDFNKKKERLKILREKAAERNPDEFYHGMIRGKTGQDGQRIQNRGNLALGCDTVKLLKTQDANYIRTMIQQTKRSREKLEQQYLFKEDKVLLLNGDKTKVLGQHFMFAENMDEQKQLCLDLNVLGSKRTIARAVEDNVREGHMTEDQIQSNMNFSHVEQKPGNGTLLTKQSNGYLRQYRREREALKLKLEAIKTREKNLFAAQQGIGLQRAKMSNSVGGVTKGGMRWRTRERKK